MFQFAAGYALAKLRHEELVLDTGDFRRQKHHNGFELPIFGNLPSKDMPEKLRSSVQPQSLLQKLWSRYVRRVVRVTEPHFHFSEDFFHLTKSKHVYLEGYWQSERYFKRFEPAIRDLFTFTQTFSRESQAISTKIQAVSSVSLHVRRGDYVNNAHTNSVHGTCSLDYYRNAIGTVIRTIATPYFFVFSDDVSWARSNLELPPSTEFVSCNTGTNSWQDMALMAACQYNIIANSTFSWWAAWLNTNPRKRVIAPKQWFRTESLSTKDLYPPGWQLL